MKFNLCLWLKEISFEKKKKGGGGKSESYQRSYYNFIIIIIIFTVRFSLKIFHEEGRPSVYDTMWINDSTR